MPRERRAGKARLADTALNPAGWQRAPGRPPFLHCIIEQAGGQAGGAGGHVENATDFLFNLSCVAGHFSQEFRSGNGWKVPALLGEARALRGKAAAASVFFSLLFLQKHLLPCAGSAEHSGTHAPLFFFFCRKKPHQEPVWQTFCGEAGCFHGDGGGTDRTPPLCGPQSDFHHMVAVCCILLFPRGHFFSVPLGPFCKLGAHGAGADRRDADAARGKLPSECA